MAVQVMHNGVLIEKDSYCGPWMTEIIRCLRGFHEPQEELVFANIVDRLLSSEDSPSMIELGCWWSFYSLWFRKALPASRVVAVEPDLEYLNVAKRHFALNHESADFVHGGIAAGDAPTLGFLAQSDGRVHDVPQYNLAQLLEMHGLERASLVLADIQGAETALIEGARDVLADGRIRFMVVSTHHHSISGDPLTHQRTLSGLQELGAHVIAEHSVGESYSGDGMVAVSFDPADRDFDVALSRTRQCESLFGDLEPELANAQSRASAAESAVANAERSVSELAVRVAELETDLNETRRSLSAMEETKTWRWSRRVLRNRARMVERLKASGLQRARGTSAGSL
jgi:FkbM family methyltransferase